MPRNLLVTLSSLLLAPSLPADEGMWLFNAPPRQLLKEKYDFDLTDGWLRRAQLASVRFNSGGSGGFVSADGLIVTNHHIGADCLAKLSTPEKDYLRDGFHARTRAEELRCPDLELNVLQEILDVTGKVRSAVKPDMDPAEAFAARRAAMSAVEKESLEKTGLRSDVVTLYQGGQYHLYRFKKYTDVRLVFAPEEGIAFFGGDTDNFEYPRYNLDVCFFRAYEDGKPARVGHYFRWNAEGPRAGDLVFVTGHPGSTNRLDTYEQLVHRRDVFLPYMLNRLRTMEALFAQFSEQGPAQEQMARKWHHRYANGRKAYNGQYQGLLNPAVMVQKRNSEAALLAQAKEKGEALHADAVKAVKVIADAERTFREFELEYRLIERGDGFDSELFGIARHLVRLAEERAKPNADRLREYRESALESLEFELFSPAPIHRELERARLARSLSFLAENLGGGHPFVEGVFAGKAPADRAAELINGTTLVDPVARKRLAEGGKEAVAASEDPLIRLAREIDPRARELRKRFETAVEAPERQAHAELARVRFEVLGTGIAPDATFTLRLAFGVVQGYEVDGKELPFHTTFAGAYRRAEEQGHREPFVLPRRWREGRDKVNPETPFNFVSTADTIGGNSGSPVLNRAGELVGINFDRNRHGLVRNFVYTDVQARHISVHAGAVVEALKKLYGAKELLRELRGG